MYPRTEFDHNRQPRSGRHVAQAGSIYSNKIMPPCHDAKQKSKMKMKKVRAVSLSCTARMSMSSSDSTALYRSNLRGFCRESPPFGGQFLDSSASRASCLQFAACDSQCPILSPQPQRLYLHLPMARTSRIPALSRVMIRGPSSRISTPS
jgi:hypothetical protein